MPVPDNSEQRRLNLSSDGLHLQSGNDPQRSTRLPDLRIIVVVGASVLSAALLILALVDRAGLGSSPLILFSTTAASDASAFTEPRLYSQASASTRLAPGWLSCGDAEIRMEFALPLPSTAVNLDLRGNASTLYRLQAAYYTYASETLEVVPLQPEVNVLGTLRSAVGIEATNVNYSFRYPASLWRGLGRCEYLLPDIYLGGENDQLRNTVSLISGEFNRQDTTPPPLDSDWSSSPVWVCGRQPANSYKVHCGATVVAEKEGRDTITNAMVFLSAALFSLGLEGAYDLLKEGRARFG